MTRCCIYARKSTDDSSRSEDAQSSTRQIELARAFAARQGWTVDDAHVYRDDGLSGGDFVNRAGLAALLAAAQSTPRPFDMIVTMDGSRIGRDQYRTAYVLQQLTDAGVQVWYYQEARQAKLDDATGKFMESVQGFAAEMEREKARARTREALHRKAAAGYVAGGVVFGYDNQRTSTGHVERIVNEMQAAVVRRIFEMIAAGHGFLRVAVALNADGIPAPRGPRWSVTSLRNMVDNPLYRGRVIYGRSRVDWRGGSRRKSHGVEDDLLEQDKPELRIVDEPLWKAAHARLARTRQTFSGHRKDNGQLAGRPESGLLNKHLLAGHLRCGICGAGLYVQTKMYSGGKVKLYFYCTARYKCSGSKACSNGHGVPYEKITNAILGHFRDLEGDVLVRMMRDEWDRRRQELEAARANRDAVEQDIRRLDGELARLADAVASGGDFKALRMSMEARQRQRDDQAALLEHLDGLSQDRLWNPVRGEWEGPFPDGTAWLEWLLPRLQGFKAALDADPATGRAVVRELLPEPVTVTPVLAQGRLVGWDYLGTGVLDRVLTGQIDAGKGRPGRFNGLPNPSRIGGNSSENAVRAFTPMPIVTNVQATTTQP